MNLILPDVISSLGWALLHFTWQGLVVGALAAAALMLMRNARPQARYAVACAALALCMALPLLTMARHSTASASASADAPLQVTPTDRAAPSAAQATTGNFQHQLQPRLPLIVALWSIGASLLALRMALGLAWVARADRPGIGTVHVHWQARLDQLAQSFALPRRVLLRVVEDLEGPVTARFWRPVVLVPAALIARLPPDLLEALLAHELAHVKRHDYLVNLLQSAVEALLFYHPVVWWLSRQVRLEREQIADDLAAKALGNPRQLARALNQLALIGAPTPALAPAAHGGNLMSRIQRLVRPRPHALDWKLALPIVGLAVACVSVFAQGPTPAASGATPRNSVIATAPAKHDAGEFMLVGPDNTGPSFLSADYDSVRDVDALRARFGPAFLWFRQHGRAYVVQDAALVTQAREAWAPTEPVGKQMEAIGQEMEGHGKKMEAIGARMEAVGEADGARTGMDEIGKKMEALGEQMTPLAERMGKARSESERDQLQAEMDELTAKMDALGARMDEHSAQMQRQLAPLEALSAEMERASAPMEPLSARMDELGKQMDQLSKAATQRTYVLIDQAVREGKAIAVEPTKQ